MKAQTSPRASSTTRKPRLLFAGLLIASLTLANHPGFAENIAVWQDSGSVTYFNDEILAAGQTPVTLASLSAGSLAGLDALILLNGSNSGYHSSMVSAAGDLAAFVSAGGQLHFFDRTAGQAQLASLNAILPGAFDFSVVFGTSANLDLSAPAHPWFSGLDHTSFDGGNSAAHGYVLSVDLPAGALSLINVQGDAGRIVDFTYAYGLGLVHYSTIPADYYGSGNGSTSFNGAVSTYVQNIAATVESVPEPSTGLLVALGGSAALFHRRRRIPVEAQSGVPAVEANEPAR